MCGELATSLRLSWWNLTLFYSICKNWKIGLQTCWWLCLNCVTSDCGSYRANILIFVQDWQEKAPCGSYLIVLASMHLCILSLWQSTEFFSQQSHGFPTKEDLKRSTWGKLFCPSWDPQSKAPHWQKKQCTLTLSFISLCRSRQAG